MESWTLNPRLMQIFSKMYSQTEKLPNPKHQYNIDSVEHTVEIKGWKRISFHSLVDEGIILKLLESLNSSKLASIGGKFL